MSKKVHKNIHNLKLATSKKKKNKAKVDLLLSHEGKK